MTEPRRLVPAEDTLAGAVAVSLAGMTLSPEDQGVRRLAEQYALQIDQAEDRARALEVLGPKLLAALDALQATPLARARVSKGVTPSGPSPLDRIREARR
jgi:hypothetical protein